MPENSSNFKLCHYFYQMFMNIIVHFINKITVMIKHRWCDSAEEIFFIDMDGT